MGMEGSDSVTSIKNIHNAVLNIDSPSDKEKNNKLRWIASIRSLLEELIQQFQNQQFIQQEKLAELEAMLEREARLNRADKEAEQLLQRLQEERAQIQRNIEAMQQKPSLLAEVHQNLAQLSLQAAQLSVLRAEFAQVQRDIIDPAIRAIEESLASVETSLASPAVLPEEEILALCDKVKNIDAEVGRVRDIVDGWFDRFVKAKDEADSLASLTETSLYELRSDNTFAPELEPLYEDLVNLKKDLNVEDLLASFKAYQRQLKDFDDRNAMAREQIATRVQIAPIAYPSLSFSLGTNPNNFWFKPQPSAGHGKRRDKDDLLLQTISGSAGINFGRNRSF